MSIFNNIAADSETLSPTSNRLTGDVISIDPREILVGIDKAWKKEVFSGPRPVLVGGTVTLERLNYFVIKNKHSWLLSGSIISLDIISHKI